MTLGCKAHTLVSVKMDLHVMAIDLGFASIASGRGESRAAKDVAIESCEGGQDTAMWTSAAKRDNSSV